MLSQTTNSNSTVNIYLKYLLEKVAQQHFFFTTAEMRLAFYVVGKSVAVLALGHDVVEDVDAWILEGVPLKGNYAKRR
jgi:hypothetical protein